MFAILFWIYLVNCVLLINHEIDSAYWKEWDLFRLPGGITGFLLIHLPLVFLILYGLVLVSRHSPTGLVFSLILSFAGVFAFTIHMFFIKKGRNEFNVPISLFMLVAILVTSVVQAAFTMYLLAV